MEDQYGFLCYLLCRRIANELCGVLVINLMISSSPLPSVESHLAHK